IEVDPDLQCLLIVVLGLLPSLLLLGEQTQLVQGSGLGITVIEVDPDLQCLLIVVLGLLPPLLLLGEQTQLVQGSGLSVTIVEIDLDLQGLLVVVLGLLPLSLFPGGHTQVVVDRCANLSYRTSVIVRLLKTKREGFVIGCFCFCVVLEQKVPLRNVI